MKPNNFLKIVLVCLFLAVAALFVSCSSTPSSGDAKQIVQQKIEKFSHGRIKLVSFEKTNGQQAERFGIKVYNLEFVCEIEFLDDCKWIPPFGTAKLVKSQDFWAKFEDDLKSIGNQSRPVKKGNTAKVTSYVVFEKTEKGWREARI